MPGATLIIVLWRALPKAKATTPPSSQCPCCFGGVWSELKNANHYGLVFITQLQRFLTINAVLIIAGAVFGVSLFESYPLSGRWGYSGLLWHNSINNILYGVCSLKLLEQKEKPWGSIVLFFLALLFLGQKAGLLYLLLIFVFVIIKSLYLRLGLFAVGFGALVASPLWLPYVISFLPFWENVYNKHGVWGVLLSLRNENIEKIWGIISSQLTAFDVMFGEAIRFPMRIEMLPFDILIYFGILGLLLFVLLLFKIIPRWKWSIPIFVACFGGGIYEAPLGMLLFFVTLALVKQCKHSYSP